MPTLLKNFFDRRNQPTPEEVQAMDCARMALQSRVDQMLRKGAARATIGQLATDAFGRALQ